jgi:ArsR family transcriptional regulator
MPSDTELTGPTEVKLWASSTAPDTDFTAKLVAVAPDGSTLNLNDGIICTPFRDSLENPTPTVPGQPYQYTIRIWPTSYLVRQAPASAWKSPVATTPNSPPTPTPAVATATAILGGPAPGDHGRGGGIPGPHGLPKLVALLRHGTHMSKQEFPVIASVDCCATTLSSPLDADTASVLAAAFKAPADPVRLRLLSLIAAAGGQEVCFCELTPALQLSQPTISHHLKVLRKAGLLTSQRRGTRVYYRIIPEALQQLSGILVPTGLTALPA